MTDKTVFLSSELYLEVLSAHPDYTLAKVFEKLCGEQAKSDLVWRSG